MLTPQLLLRGLYSRYSNFFYYSLNLVPLNQESCMSDVSEGKQYLKTSLPQGKGCYTSEHEMEGHQHNTQV